MPVFIDITEFVQAPHRTGIQRVCGELIRNWPETGKLIPVKVGRSGELVHLPADTVSLVREYFSAEAHAVAALAEQIKNAGLQEGPRVDWSGHRLLVPEVFYERSRIEFYERIAGPQLQRVAFLVYDLLPLTHPQFYRAGMPIHIVGEYFRLIRRAHSPAFISRAVRNTYYERLLRKSGDGPVLRLGSDSLKSLQSSGGPAGNSDLHFSVVGTIEPRKRHLQVLRAFKPLLASVPGLKLTFAGKLGWLDAVDARELQSATSWPGFEWIQDVSDSGIAGVLSRSRASLFLSAAEGFGLPPVESLSLRVPVIASRGIPSLEDIGETGLRLVSDDPDSIRQAVLDFCDDVYHARKCAEVRTLNLPTWATFSQDVLAWINSAAGNALQS